MEGERTDRADAAPAEEPGRRSSDASTGKPRSSSDPSGVAEQQIGGNAAVGALAKQTLAEVIAAFGETAGWSDSEEIEGVRIMEKPVPGATFPMVRAELKIPDAAMAGVQLPQVCSVAFSHTCRKFWDTQYDGMKIIERGSGGSSALVCYFGAANPLQGATCLPGVLGLQRSSDSAGSQRITLALSRAPQDLKETFADQIARACGQRKEATTRMRGIEVARFGDGYLRIRSLTAMEKNPIWLPSFVVKGFIGKSTASHARQIWQMAAAGMLPKRSVALTPGDEEEALVECDVSGRRLTVSSLLREAFLS